MTCEHARALIDGFVLDELSPAQARTLADHVRGCVACTAELAGASFLIELLATLPEVAPSAPDFDARVLAAAFAERDARHAQRGWLGDLRAQILRGTLRTTGTFVATVLLVAVLAVGGVWAASSLFLGTPQSAGLVHDATPRPTVTAPTVAPTVPASGVQTSPTVAPTPSPRVIVVTVTPSPTPRASASATPRPSPTIAPTPGATPTASASPTPTSMLTPAPTPEPTFGRRTPPPSPSPAGSAEGP